jgi:hypothetical protein
MLPLATVEPQAAPALPPFHVEVKFGPGVTADAQGKMMLAWERWAREHFGVPVELYKATRADDLVRRRTMTDEDRKRL